MDTSVLETIRTKHEEMERYEDLCSKTLQDVGRSTRDIVIAEHKVAGFITSIQTLAADLKGLYVDSDGVKASEITSMDGNGVGNEKAYDAFLEKLSALKDTHRRFIGNGEIAEPMEVEFERIGELSVPTVTFSDEEGHGARLDLHELHRNWLNLEQMEKMDYLTYIGSVNHFFKIPREKKRGGYRKYLVALQGYLMNFHERALPLVDIYGVINGEVANTFNDQWARGEFIGWSGVLEEARAASEKAEKAEKAAIAAGPVNLDRFKSPKELEELGMDILKGELQRLNLKCGGNLQQRAERLFSSKGKSMAELPASIKSTTVKKDIKLKTAGASQVSKVKVGEPAAREKEIAWIEAQCYALIERLSDHLESTKVNVERKMTRTAGEMDDADEEGSELEDIESDDDDDQVIYNPKNLPLDWDGKPIPYWLYKLHGLNINYDCEICGNETYRGPLAFQRHFQDWRHSHGMRCLGIPNTVHFRNITLIEDAKALWERLQSKKNKDVWRADVDEEYEDSKGNVVTKKVYDDLARQGLL